MKIILVILVLGITGCGSPTPPSPQVIKACLDKGLTPDYFSNAYKIRYVCVDRKKE